MIITINKIVFLACITVIGLATLFGVVAIFDEGFRKDILLVGPAILAPIITLATAMAGIYKATNGGRPPYQPPPKEPSDAQITPPDASEGESR